MSELTDDDLAAIRFGHADGDALLLRRLAQRYGISAECVEAIVHWRPWRHLADPADDTTGDLFDGRKR